MANGAGSAWTPALARTLADVSNSAARLTSNRGLSTVARTWSSGAFTATGVTHAYGLSPDTRKRYVESPAAFRTGPFTRTMFGKNGTSGTFVNKYLVFVSCNTFGMNARRKSEVK